MLRLPARKLAENSGLSSMLILGAEVSDKQVLTPRQGDALRRALEAAGVVQAWRQDAEAVVTGALQVLIPGM
jgi:hypothetical protein